MIGEPTIATTWPKPAIQERTIGTSAPRRVSERPTELTQKQLPTVGEPGETVGEGPVIGPTRQTIAPLLRQIASSLQRSERPFPSMRLPALNAGTSG